MEAIRTLPVIRKQRIDSEESVLSKKVKKYYTKVEELFVYKTKAEKRRELFGKDPLLK